MQNRRGVQGEILEPVLVDVPQSSLTSRVSGPGTPSSLCGEGTGDFLRSWLSLHFRAQDFPPPRLCIAVLYVAGSKREKLAYQNT